MLTDRRCYRSGRYWIILPTLRVTIDINTDCSTEETMVLFTYIILLAFLYDTLAKDCLINNVPERMAFEKQLRKDLKCGYHPYDPPSKNMSTFAVNIKFNMKRFEFSSDEGVLSIQSWMFLSWKDERVKWDPEKYYGIEETEMSSIHLWTPGIRLYNTADSNDFDRFFYARCILKNTGDVSCLHRIIHESLCSVKLTYWPYDQQECSLEFGPWTSKLVNFRLNFTSRAISMWGAEYGSEWFISDYRQESNHSSERQLKMIFVLERESTGLAALVLYPAVILSALSLTCLFLDVRRHVRLPIACFSLLGHYNFLMELAEEMPKQSVDPPNLLLYYRGSVILTVLIIMLTFLLRIICKLKSPPQNYIITANDFMYESYRKYFICPQWDFDDDTSSKQFSQDWTKFANIINSVFVVVIIIAYISLYCTLIPKPIPVNY